MDRLNFHETIFESVRQYHKLLATFELIKHHNMWIATVKVGVPGGRSPYAFPSDPHQNHLYAQEEAYHRAYTWLDQHGFSRRHFKADLIGLQHGQGWQIEFVPTRTGPENRAVWTSQIWNNGRPTHFVARGLAKLHAEELAAKRMLEHHRL